MPATKPIALCRTQQTLTRIAKRCTYGLLLQKNIWQISLMASWHHVSMTSKVLLHLRFIPFFVRLIMQMNYHDKMIEMSPNDRQTPMSVFPAGLAANATIATRPSYDRRTSRIGKRLHFLFVWKTYDASMTIYMEYRNDQMAVLCHADAHKSVFNLHSGTYKACSLNYGAYSLASLTYDSWNYRKYRAQKSSHI